MTSVRAKAIEEMRKKALVRHTDMSQEMSSDAQDVVVMALDKYMEAENWEAASKLIKDTLDKKLGPPWHVMVGKGVGFDCTYQQHFIQLTYYNSCSALIFKT